MRKRQSFYDLSGENLVVLAHDPSGSLILTGAQEVNTAHEAEAPTTDADELNKVNALLKATYNDAMWERTHDKLSLG